MSKITQKRGFDAKKSDTSRAAWWLEQEALILQRDRYLAPLSRYYHFRSERDCLWPSNCFTFDNKA